MRLNRPGRTSLALALTCALASPTWADGLRVLTDTPTKNRIPIGPVSWPAKAGDAEVCLWKDDKVAALSITIDDNTALQVDEWLKRAKPVDFPLTWFVISTKVGTGDYWGTWESWQKVVDGGQAVQSHTMTHLDAERPGWLGIQWEYEQSQKDLQEKLKGNKVNFLAYPGGKGSNLNDRNVAAKFYLSARGTRGTINPPGRVDYLNVNAMSGATLTNAAAAYAYVPNILDPKAMYYRGWAVVLYHRVDDWDKAQAFLNFYQDNQKEVWAGSYGDVALYGQERDTAKLTTVESSADKIRLALTDGMDDSLYAYPLTLKVRLPDRWRTVVAKQGEKAIACSVVEHDGGRFALVNAVPDRGEIGVENGFE